MYVSILNLKKSDTGCKWCWSVYYPITEQIIDYQTNQYGEGIYEVFPGARQLEGDCDFRLRGITTYSGVFKKLRRYFGSGKGVLQ